MRFLDLTLKRIVAFWIPNESGKIFFWESGQVSPSLEQTAASGSARPGPDLAPAARERRISERLIIYLLTLLSAVGGCLLFRRDRVSAVVCLSCLALFPLVYYVIQFDPRYRYPIMWLTFLLGSLPITELVRRLKVTLSARSSVAVMHVAEAGDRVEVLNRRFWGAV